MKKLNKVLALALAASMVVSMAACGKKNDEPATSTPTKGAEATKAPAATSTPTPEPTLGPLKITVSLPSDEEHLEADAYYDKIVADINAYTNMDITWQWQQQATYFDDEHLGLKLASHDVADVLIVGGNDAFYKACDEGLFWDLTPYLQDYPNLATIPAADIQANSRFGKIYGIPRSRDIGRAGWGYRQDWLNNVGLDEPTTWEEVKVMLQKFTENDPNQNGIDDTCGLLLDSWGDCWNIMGLWFGVPNTWGLDSKGDLIYKINTPEYKTFLKEFRELYAKGYINNGSIEGISDWTDYTPGSIRKVMVAEKAGMYVQCLDDCRKVQTGLEATYGEAEDEEDVMFTLRGWIDAGYGPRTFPWKAGVSNLIAVSTVNIKTETQLRQVLNFLDKMNDGEMLNLVDFGYEDVEWERTTDKDGYTWLKAFDAETITANLDGASSKYRNGFNQIPGYYTAEENARPIEKEVSMSPIMVLERKYRYTENPKYVVPNYGLGLEAMTNTFNTEGVMAQLNDIVWNSLVSYVKGEIDDTGLEESINQWNKAGGAQLTKEINALYHAN